MTPRLFVWIVTLIVLVLVLVLARDLADQAVESDSLEHVEPHVWPTVVADPNPAYARLAFIAALKPRARTAPTKRTVVRAASAGPVVLEGSVNGYPCGGSLPPCYVLARESGGNPTAQNPHSTASGLWQVLDSTWRGYGGYAKARLAPASVQNDFARMLWANGAGCHHWFACGAR